MADARIPFFPRGRPRSAVCEEHLREILVYAGLDLARAIEPSLTLEEQRKGIRPPDRVLMQRFTDRGMRRIGELTELAQLVLLVPWRAGVEPGFRETLWEIVRRVPQLPIDLQSRHVLFMESPNDERDFTDKHGPHRELWGTTFGAFFLVRWPGAESPKEIGRRLRDFLSNRLRASSTIPPALEVPALRLGTEPQRAKSSASHFRAALEILAQKLPPAAGEGE